MNRRMTAGAAALLLTAGCSNPPVSDRQPATIRDCDVCPALVEIPAGEFLMGTAEADRLIDPRTGKPATNDGPQHRVSIAAPFLIGQHEVTVAEYRAFVDDTGHAGEGGCMEFSKKDSFTIDDAVTWDAPGFDQAESAPVGCVSYTDAQAYAAWLSQRAGREYRLPTEAEWEYAARAGATTPYFWGRDETIACDYANIRSLGAYSISKRQSESDLADGFPCDDGAAQSSPAGRYRPNAFGLYDTQGNNWEWVADCNHKNYDGAPTDGSAWLDDEGCQFGVIRGGSYINRVERSSVTVRAGRPRSGRATNMGFRIASGGTNTAGARVAASAFVAGDPAAETSAGARLFAENCAACHVDRTDFRGAYGTTQSEVEQAIRDGGNNIMSMPAFGDVLDDDEIGTLARYVRAVNDWN